MTRRWQSAGLGKPGLFLGQILAVTLALVCTQCSVDAGPGRDSANGSPDAAAPSACQSVPDATSAFPSSDDCGGPSDGADQEDCGSRCQATGGGTWVHIGGGSFGMGCAPEEDKCDSDEKPFHTVAVSSFYMLETEVTISQFEAVMSEPHSSPFGVTGPDFPAAGISWFEARDFCTRIGGRLPTEAEWEYAARGGTTGCYYCGTDAACVPEIAWLGEASGGAIQRVGRKLPNAFGLYDMLGNLWEWCNDWYAPHYYGVSPELDPIGPDQGEERVKRGGDYVAGVAFEVCVHNRLSTDPKMHGWADGFRCVKDVGSDSR